MENFRLKCELKWSHFYSLLVIYSEAEVVYEKGNDRCRLGVRKFMGMDVLLIEYNNH